MGRPPAPKQTVVNRKCLFCRRPAISPASNVNLKSCAISLCTIFGLPINHPFRVIYERAQYCANCLTELQQADVTLGKLELMKQTLLRFQNRVYSMLGDNYFQIGNREELGLTFAEFEAAGEGMKGKRFSYDEVVKVVYEKLHNDCFKWERFTSEGKSETSSKTDTATQTETMSISKDLPDDFVTIDDIEVDHEVECGADDTANEFDTRSEFGGSSVVVLSGALNTTAQNQSIVNVNFSSSSRETSSGPDHPFTKAPLNFNHKIYCTFDPSTCQRFFYDNYNLSVHIKSFHQGNPLPHECTMCSKGFVDEGRLKSHYMRLHASSSSYMCEHCGKGFATPTIVKDHVRRKHTPNPKEMLNCSFCGANFQSEKECQDHEALHKAKEYPFSCVYCDVTFTNSYALKGHFTKFHSDHRFPCDLCGKVMSSELSLKMHLNIHTDAFKCTECEFSGSCKNSLKQHMLSHSNEKPYTCESCGKCFKYQKNLQSHQRIHTGEKPYVCSLCGATFREVSYLRRHEESHSSRVNYECPICGAGFKVKENLKKHERTHRPDYVPRKKEYKPRTEEQKEARRLRQEERRKELGLPVGPRRNRGSGKIKKVKEKLVRKTIVVGPVVKRKKVKDKKKNRKKVKTLKKIGKKAKALKVEEIPKIEEEVIAEEEMMAYSELTVASHEEIKEAVQSLEAETIGEVVVTTAPGEYFEAQGHQEVVYHAESEETREQMGLHGQGAGIQTTTTYIPVTLVSNIPQEQVVRTLGRRPNTNQYQFL